MLLSRLLLRGICLLVLISSAMGKCQEPTPLNHTIVRTTEIQSGDRLFSFHAPNANVFFSIRPIESSSSWKDKYYFAMRRAGNVLEHFIIKPSELESSIKPYIGKICGLGLKVTFTCRDVVDSSTLTFKRNLYFRSPDAMMNVNLTLQKFNIREDALVLDKVVSLMVIVLNPKPSIALTRFVAHPFIDLDTNALSIVTVAQDGNVYLKRALNSEGDDKFYSLNITVLMSLFVCTGESDIEPGSIQTIDGFVQFSIININDKSPRFVFPGCPPTCGPTHYTTSVGETFKGDLTSIENGPISAIDDDGDQIEYSFKGGSPILYDLYFSINDQTGLVSMLRPMNDDDMIVMTLIILAQSTSVLPETALARPENKVYTFLMVWIKGKERVYLSSRFLLGSSSGAIRSLPRPSCILGNILMIVVVLII